MRAIHEVASQHGIKVVFIVPPVYESDRRGSLVNRQATTAPASASIDVMQMMKDAKHLPQQQYDAH
jgi:hypothetical protein